LPSDAPCSCRGRRLASCVYCQQFPSPTSRSCQMQIDSHEPCNIRKCIGVAILLTILSAFGQLGGRPLILLKFIIIIIIITIITIIIIIIIIPVIAIIIIIVIIIITIIFNIIIRVAWHAIYYQLSVNWTDAHQLIREVMAAPIPLWVFC